MSLVAVDIETRGLDSTWNPDTEVLTYSLYSPDPIIGHTFHIWSETSRQNLIKVAQEHTLIFHNASFDVPTLRLRGVPIRHNVHNKELSYHDTMLMAYCWDSSGFSYSLDTLSALVGEKKVYVAKEDWSTVAPWELEKRNLSDVKITYLLWEYFFDLFGDDPEGWQNYLEIECPYIESIIQMETIGVCIDSTQLVDVKAEAIAERDDGLKKALEIRPWKTTEAKEYSLKQPLEYKVKRSKYSKREVLHPISWTSYKLEDGEKVYTHCPLEPFNPNSGAQVAEALIQLYGWKPENFSRKTQQPVVDADALEDEGSPLSKAILQFREYDKLLSTYVKPIEEQKRLYGVVRGNFNQCITHTHRLSSSNPNLQNIPVRSSAFRRVFVPRPGYTFLVGDLDRIEVAVLGFYLELLFGSTILSDAVRNGEDVHQVNADLWGIDRGVAKNTFFCILYGGAEDRIAKTAGISVNRATRILKQIQEKLPELLLFREYAAQTYEERGVLHDWFGARLCLPRSEKKKDGYLRPSGKRKIGNYIIQCPAGQIFKLMQNEFFAANLQAFMDGTIHQLIVVHDEGVYEVLEDQAEYYQGLLNKTFSNNTIFATEEFFVPVKAEFKIGKNWLEAKG